MSAVLPSNLETTEAASSFGDVIAFAIATCMRATAYADGDDRVGLAMAAALLRCDLSEQSNHTCWPQGQYFSVTHKDI